MLKQSSIAILCSVALLSVSGCNDDTTKVADNPVKLMNRSATPALVKNVMSGLEVFSLLGSDDTLANTPAYVFGGSADGSGWWKNTDGTFSAVINNEDNYAVSRITFDNTFKPVGGEYLINSTTGKWRLCSATLVTPEVHGFGPTFLTCGESNAESMVHAINPTGAANSDVLAEGFGHWSAENAVPLPKDAFSGKTVVLIGDDDSGADGGQLALYVSSTVGDLQNGNLYVLCRTNDVMKETDMVVGQQYSVQFRQIPNQKTLTGAQINTAATALKCVQFGRVEDVDFRKGSGNGREVYFNATGQNNTGVNADNSRTKYGRTYHLTLDPSDPTKGTLECILDGDNRSGAAGKFQNPDNICVTENYVYISEDPNGYGDETHDAYLYQYNISTKELKIVMELDHHRGDTKYNVGGDSKFGAWEYGSLTDISDIVGIPNTFALCIQAHSWTGTRYKGVDGGTLRPNEDQASQVVIIKGLSK